MRIANNKHDHAKRVPSVMFIAGDPSGDVHAAAVVGTLKKIYNDIDVWGIGGPKMSSVGFRQVMPFEPFNRMGYAEVIGGLPFFLSAKKKLLRVMKNPQTRPDVLVCVDYSGFNMPMMKEAKKLNIPVVWYIAPMVWAWKRKRAKILGEHAAHIAVIFPFETQYFSMYNAPVTFVGNPLVESLPPIKKQSVINDIAKKIDANNIDADKNQIKLAIIPGSRPQEIKNMLYIMTCAAMMLRDKYPNVKITVSKFGSACENLFDELAARHNIEIFTGNLRSLLQESDLALVTSGTATLETALAGVPMVIAYKTSRVTYAIYKKFVRIKDIGLPNIIAQNTIVPECVQNNATPENLYKHLCEYVFDNAHYAQTKKKLLTLRSQLGDKSPSAEVSKIICSYLS